VTLAGRDQHGQRAAVTVDGEVDLGRQATPAASQRLTIQRRLGVVIGWVDRLV